MKILFVMGGLRFGGYEVLNVEIANQLIERGFEVSIISFSKEDQLLSRVSDSIDIFYVDKSSKLSALLEVRKALKIIKPDIILSCDILEYLIPRIGSVFLKHKARFIYAFHVTKPPTKKDHFWNKVLSFSDRIFRDNKIAIHRSQIDFYNSNYSLSEERFSLIYNGVDTEKFCPAVKREESAGDIIRLVHVASLKPLKDQWTLLKAMVELNKNSKDWELNIAGSDVAGLKSEYSLFLKENGLGGKVKFLGPVKDVRSLLERSDLFILTSTTEALPMSILEAFASGVPAIATNVGGCPEIIEEGKTGYLVEVGDFKNISDRIRILIKDPGLLNEMGISARRRAEELFSMKIMIEKYISLFRQVTGLN